MTDRNPDRYENLEDVNRRIRCKTLRFEAHFIETAIRNRWQIFNYRGEPHADFPNRPLRD
jgi:hypothetical protein